MSTTQGCFNPFSRPSVVACLIALFVPALAGATTLPSGFTQTTAIAGLTKPMDVEIAPNGRIFVAEKSGIVKTYDSIADTTATIAADLRTQVHNFSARGLQSLAVDPGFPTKPYIYVVLQPRRQDRRHAAAVRNGGSDQRQTARRRPAAWTRTASRRCASRACSSPAR